MHPRSYVTASFLKNISAFGLVILLILGLTPYFTIAQRKVDQQQGIDQISFLPNQIIVAFKKTTESAGITEELFCKEFGVELVSDGHKEFATMGLKKISRQLPFAAKVPDGVDVESVLENLSRDNRVEYARGDRLFLSYQ